MFTYVFLEVRKSETEVEWKCVPSISESFISNEMIRMQQPENDFLRKCSCGSVWPEVFNIRFHNILLKQTTRYSPVLFPPCSCSRFLRLRLLLQLSLSGKDASSDYLKGGFLTTSTHQILLKNPALASLPPSQPSQCNGSVYLCKQSFL